MLYLGRLRRLNMNVIRLQILDPRFLASNLIINAIGRKDNLRFALHSFPRAKLCIPLVQTYSNTLVHSIFDDTEDSQWLPVYPI